MFERMLVPLDGSTHAEQALPLAARLAHASGGAILLVQVVTPPIDYGGGLAPVPLWTSESGAGPRSPRRCSSATRRGRSFSPRACPA